MSDEDFKESRQRMIAVITAKAIYACMQLGKAALAPRVMQAIAEVPRHMFVPPQLRNLAYDDTPLPIGCGKTISQPFIVAVMTDLLDVQPTDSVLEIGTGRGYQTAVLAALAQRVFSVERIEALGDLARRRLAELGSCNIEFRIGDGQEGWPEHAPFDKVMVTAAAGQIPQSLIAQLKPGGRMVLPAGPPDVQQLVVVEKRADGSCSQRDIFAVCFSQLDGAESGLA